MRPIDSLSGARRAIRAVVEGRRWVVAAPVAAAASVTVGQLRAGAAADVLVVAAAPGMGTAPDAEVVMVPTSEGPGLMGGIRTFLDAIVDPSAQMMAAIDAFDPSRSALVVCPPFASSVHVLGRRAHGARLPGWVALEDKTTADELWDAAGVARAPSLVVAVEEAPRVATSLDRGLGTVWAADNTEGWHGGADYTRPLDPGGDAEALVAWFGARAASVRVMPFLEGIPCSIHGFVTDHGVAAFRPIELVVFRRTDTPTFLYGGVSSFWDPPEVDRRAMRDAARRVGATLHGQVGYRGPFSIDGVLTADGFRPTELNPRLSLGLDVQAGRIADFDLEALTRSFVEGELDVDPVWLEQDVVEAADFTRFGGMGVPLPDLETPERTGFVRFGTTQEPELVADAADADASVSVGPSDRGSRVRMLLDPAKVAPGPPVGPRAAAVLSLLAAEWGLAIPPVEAASPASRRA
jgi:hypothetical protein